MVEIRMESLMNCVFYTYLLNGFYVTACFYVCEPGRWVAHEGIM